MVLIAKALTSNIVWDIFLKNSVFMSNYFLHATKQTLLV